MDDGEGVLKQFRRHPLLCEDGGGVLFGYVFWVKIPAKAARW